MSLEIKNLSKRFGNNWVFRNLSLTAEPGKVTGIFGSTGCGKTTLLEMISTDEKPGSGTISGLDLTNSKLIGMPSNEKRSWLPFFGNKAFAGNRIEQFAELFGSNAKLILLDSPFSGLDIAVKESLSKKLFEYAQKKSATVIFASSDFNEILQFCDEAAVIEKGEVMQFGRPQEIYDEPATVAIAELTGPNNLFEARRLSSSKAEIPEFQTIEGEHKLFGRKTELGSLGAINQNIILGIRPEQISMTFGASFPEDNLIKAKIVKIKPRGAETRVELDAEGLRLEALVPRLIGLNIGDECMLGLPPDRIRPFSH